MIGRVSDGSRQVLLQSAGFIGPWSQTARQTFVIGRAGWNGSPLLLLTSLLCLLVLGSWLVWRQTQPARLPAILPTLGAWRRQVLAVEGGSPNQELAGGFKLIRQIACGGFGTVWLAYNLNKNSERCAVKIFDQAGPGEWLAKQAQSEITALSRIKHPNVICLRGHGLTPNGSLYIAMDFIDGLTLRELLSFGQLPKSKIASLVTQLGAALDELHKHSVFHRDIKPENIMIRTSAPLGEDLVLIDFSIALLKDPGQTLQTLTKVVGSLDYMAPEHVLGFADATTDIFSFGKLILEMLTGERFSVLVGNSSIDMPEQARRILSERCPEINGSVGHLIASAVSFHPAMRPARAGEFAKSVVAGLGSVQSPEKHTAYS